MNFSAEYIVWARKHPKAIHCFHYDVLKEMNGGKEMPDVWKMPGTANWERTGGTHPTQKPLRLLYRILKVCTEERFTILDSFAGSCTTGIAAKLTERKFIGIEINSEYLDYGIKRWAECENPVNADNLRKRIAENPEEVMVMVNHCRKALKEKMIETGICYLHAGDSRGSLLITPGFERLQYVLLHTNGEGGMLFKLKSKGTFQIGAKETLEKYGFSPSHAPYYIVLHFDSSKVIDCKYVYNLKKNGNTFNCNLI